MREGLSTAGKRCLQEQSSIRSVELDCSTHHGPSIQQPGAPHSPHSQITIIVESQRSEAVIEHLGFASVHCACARSSLSDHYHREPWPGCRSALASFRGSGASQLAVHASDEVEAAWLQLRLEGTSHLLACRRTQRLPAHNCVASQAHNCEAA